MVAYLQFPNGDELTLVVKESDPKDKAWIRIVPE